MATLGPRANPDMTYANFYFTNNGVNTWNSSPSYVVSANMINCFKSKLDK